MEDVTDDTIKFFLVAYQMVIAFMLPEGAFPIEDFVAVEAGIPFDELHEFFVRDVIVF